MIRRLYTTILMVSLIIVLAVSASVKASVINLGTLGGNYSRAYGINNSGQITGVAKNSSGSDRIFFWSNGTMINTGYSVGNTPGSYSVFDLDDNGNIVGGYKSSTPYPGTEYYFWNACVLKNNGGSWSYKTLPHNSWGSTFDVSSSGKIVGYDAIYGADYQGVVWTPDANFNYSASFVVNTYGRGINSSNHIVGETFTNTLGTLSNYSYRYWSTWGGTSVVIPGAWYNNSPGGVRDISDSDEIIGSTTYSNAVVWRNPYDTNPVNLGSGFASKINDNGTIIIGNDGSDIVLWIKNGADWSDFIRIDSLNALVNDATWYLGGVTDVNNLGQVVGWGTYNGETRAFLINDVAGLLGSPVPEPHTVILLFLGASELIRRKIKR